MGLRVALVQMKVTDGNVHANLKRIEASLKYAIEHYSVEAAFTPELSLTGFSIPSKEDVRGAVNRIKELSDGVAIGVGATYFEGDKTYNSYLIVRDGDVLHVRKKFMLFEPMGEHQTFARGEPPTTFYLKDLKFSVLICYELRFPELFARVLDAEALVVPAAWPSSRKEHWRTLLRARAVEASSYVLGVNRWGEGLHGPFGGWSSSSTPEGETTLGEGEGLLVTELDKDKIEEWREFPSYKDRLSLLGIRPASGRRSGTS
ncbi:Nitrilase/cyanide hydratase and apolipoprotein N-acyltransferase [Ignicoccus hospitalis KIN4/I]|uniref:Nitrilase/cyanide hydratase and apolipoprotein N-acyltransferase n=1 Tax=Ignicoccus hospitalis (strain KIN4/I / DSM 18386 / JCM 14125) TaxID=453591 RepID=A8AAT7_IGNH4|nr:Nitrilase/cyanide hydratase and apolipoprotein N-acyltransferase [Ignicoccus hospitalis KIN4/I]